MRRPTLFFAAWIAGALGSAGCQQTETAKTVTARPSSSGDPTAWSDKVLSAESPEPGGDPTKLPKSSRLQGTFSNEARDIEKSLGVGR